MTRSPMLVRAIVAANVRRLSRDRVGLFFMFAMPFVIILLVGLTLGGTASGPERLPIGVVQHAAGVTATAIAADLAASDDLAVERYSDEPALERAVREGSLAAGVVLPIALDATSLHPRGQIGFVATSQSAAAPAARGAVQSVIDRHAARLEAERAAVTAGATLDRARRLVSAAQLQAQPVVVRSRMLGAGDAPAPRGFAYTAPANLVLFAFISSMTAAGALVETRRLGVARRVLAAPARAGALVFAETLARYLVAAVQGAVIVTVTSLVFGVSWGDPLGVSAVVLAFSAVATGAAMLVGVSLRTAGQAAAVGPPIGIVLGMLGGCMWPLEAVGTGLRTVGRLTPHGWAMDALIGLQGPGGGLDGIGAELAVLFAMAAALLALAAGRYRRSVMG